MNYIIASRRDEEIKLSDEFAGSEFKVIKQEKNNRVEVSIHEEGEEIKLVKVLPGRRKRKLYVISVKNVLKKT